MSEASHPSQTRSRTAIITGGGGAIGSAIAQILLTDGWSVVLNGRSSATLKGAAAKLATDSDRILCVAADISNPNGASLLIEKTLAWRGGFDALINNAGHAPMVPLHQTSDQQWTDILGVNLSGPFYMLRAAWPTFARQFAQIAANPNTGRPHSGGVVINISSEASRNPYPGLGAYGAAKAAINLLTRMAAIEGKPIGLRAISIAPAAVETPMFRSLPVAKEVPSTVILSPQSVANAVKSAVDGAFWCSNGETIFIHQNI